MKTIKVFTTVLFIIFVLISASVLLSEVMGHIPINHDHSSSICWGYAQGRAFGKSSGDSDCDPRTTYTDKINESYFPFVSGSSLTGIKPGDIVVFGQVRQGLQGHAAYVVYVPNPLVIDNIRVDQVPYKGGPEQTNVLLSTVKQSQGNPVGYHKGGGGATVNLTFENSFGNGYMYVTKDKFGNWRQKPSGWSGQFFVGDIVEFMAIDNQEYPPSYKQRFQNWEDDNNASNPRSITVSSSGTYKAVFLKEYNVTFQNTFLGASGGSIKVNGVTRSAPHTEKVLEINSVNFQAITNTINRIVYTFTHWSDDNTSSSRSFVPTDHSSFTAYFNAKPLPPANVQAGGNVGQYVQVTWQEHPHPNVTQYQIWRKVKKQNEGTVGPPVLLTTVNRGTTSYTDYSYIITDGYTHDLVWYDVRAYFSLNETYSDESWVAVYADGTIIPRIDTDETKKGFIVDDGIFVNSIKTYPNPFNPETTIEVHLIEESDVQLEIFDITGRKVKTLVSGRYSRGAYNFTWDGRDEGGKVLSSSVYLYRFYTLPVSGNVGYHKTGKVIFAK